jgi:YHS domain-containing protein
MIARTAALCLAALFLAAPAPALAQKADTYSSWGSAIRGYDPVAYFTEARPVKGSSQYKHEWKGATWRFASAANRDAFAAAPEKYAPQYGGYCAYGVANGYTVSTVPEAWTVVEGKLYLNYSLGVQADWRKDPAGYIRKANANWPKALER